MTRARICGVLAVLAILSAGCSTPYKAPVFESRPAGQTDFLSPVTNPDVFSRCFDHAA